MKHRVLFSAFLMLIISASAREGKNDKIFRDGFIKKTMLNAAFWQFKNPNHNLYDWTNGAFYAGVFAAWETTGNKKLFDEMIKMGEANQWKPGPRLHHADDHVICQTYIDLYRIKKDPGMIDPFIKTMDEFQKTPFPVKGIQKITWWWCDALFMAPAAYVKLGKTLNQSVYLTLNDKLFKECYDMLYNKEEHLYARDLNYVWGQPDLPEKKESNGKRIFWSRGNGWVMGGLVRVLKELPADYPQRGFYEQNFREMAQKIASLQQADGL